MKKLFLLGFAIMTFHIVALADTEIVAHRGYWKTDGSAQNSLAAYRNADRIGCWGSEIDVWITSDNVLMVNHDPTFKGVTLEKATYAEVKDLTLANGEKMPTLDEYLKVAKQGKARLVIEIKTHQDLLRQNICVDKAVELVKKHKLEKRVDYIAFSYAACLRLREKTPTNTPVYYLSGDLSPAQIKAANLTGVDYNEWVFLSNHPEWIEGCRQLGLKINVWTVDGKENLKFFLDKKVDYITTNEPEVLKTMMGK